MKKILTWAKRPVNTNFLLFVIIAVVLAFSAIDAYSSVTKTEKLVDNIGVFAEKIQDDISIGELDDWGTALSSILHDVSSAGNKVIMFLRVYIPLFIAGLIAVQALFCRLIYGSSSGRLLCYRVFTAMCCFFTTVSVLIFSLLFFFKTVSMIIVIIADIAVIAAVVICIRNTYTNRIKE